MKETRERNHYAAILIHPPTWSNVLNHFVSSQRNVKGVKGILELLTKLRSSLKLCNPVPGANGRSLLHIQRYTEVKDERVQRETRQHLNKDDTTSRKGASVRTRSLETGNTRRKVIRVSSARIRVGIANEVRRKRTFTSRQVRARVFLVATRHVIRASGRTNSSIQRGWTRTSQITCTPHGLQARTEPERKGARGRESEKKRDGGAWGRGGKGGRIATRRVASKQPLSEHSRWWKHGGTWRGGREQVQSRGPTRVDRLVLCLEKL